MRRIETFSRVDTGSCRPHLAMRAEIRTCEIRALFNFEHFGIFHEAARNSWPE
jgi:hypothetical protein